MGGMTHAREGEEGKNIGTWDRISEDKIKPLATEKGNARWGTPFREVEEDSTTDVTVNGRAGRVTWDGRPEHQFVKVRWADNQQESGVIAVSAVTFGGKASCRDADGDYAVGQLVEVRDFEKPWREGYVVSLCPLKVSYKADGPNGKGYSWDQTRAISREGYKTCATLGNDAESMLLDNMHSSEARLTVGQQVQMHDDDKPWREGYVTSVNPLKVSYKVDGPDGKGYSWDYVRAYEVYAPCRRPNGCVAQPEAPPVDAKCVAQAETPFVDAECEPPAAVGGKEEVQYGYMQIPCYSRKRSRGAKRFVTLPRGTKVEGFLPRNSEHQQQTGLSETSLTTQSSSSSSMAAKKVRFCDGAAAGDESDQLQSTGPDANAEWYFIDRDTCGLSLFEYAPQVASHKEFASSEYGREFVQEYGELQRANQIEQLKREAKLAAIQPGSAGQHCGRCGRSFQAGDPNAAKGTCCGQGLFDGLLEDFTPGIYRIVKTATLGDDADIKVSTNAGVVHTGILVKVLEVVNDSDAQRIRGRINDTDELTGWISLTNTSDGIPWVIKQDAALSEEEMEIDRSLREAKVSQFNMRIES